MLSPWIHMGSISVRHVYYRVAQVGGPGTRTAVLPLLRAACLQPALVFAPCHAL